MINWRLYRAAFVPFLLALAIAAFSLGSRPAPLTSTLAPDAFEGAPAYAQLQALAKRFPDRRPGSPGDERLAEYVAGALRELGNASGGGFSVHVHRASAQTVEGERTLSTVVAERPGSTGESPIVVVAHRDAVARGAVAELSGTAALLELARVFASRETKRPIVIASTSGGSGGAGGASQLISGLHGPVDAAIVLGDVGSSRLRMPVAIPFSDGRGSAPLQLQRTVSDAIATEVGVNPGAPSTLGQLAHLAFPFAVGEQGPLNAAGVPSMLIQASGERGPAASGMQAVSAEHLEGFGRAALHAVDALDSAPDVSREMQTSLLLAKQTMPAWVLRLLVFTLLLAPLIAVADGLARLRRRRIPVGHWVLWSLSCALPFFVCALLAYALGWLGIVGAAPAQPVLPSALPFDATAAIAVVAVALTFALAWVGWAALVRRLRWDARPDSQATGIAMLLVAVPLVTVVWVANPLAALVAVPALHLWLLLASPEVRPRRPAALALVALGLLPLLLLIGFYAHQLGLGPGDVVWMALLLVAGGHVGFGAALVWSVALGCAAVAAMLATGTRQQLEGPQFADGFEVTIRGPMSYAGPGSLGGTESALRR
jgi:hypothetical protein